jgi:hypothetical protein
MFPEFLEHLVQQQYHHDPEHPANPVQPQYRMYLEDPVDPEQQRLQKILVFPEILELQHYQMYPEGPAHLLRQKLQKLLEDLEDLEYHVQQTHQRIPELQNYPAGLGYLEIPDQQMLQMDPCLLGCLDFLEHQCFPADQMDPGFLEYPDLL